MLALQQAAAAVGPAPDLRIFVYFSIAVFACRCRNLYLMTYNKGSIALREHQSHTGGRRDGLFSHIPGSCTVWPVNLRYMVIY